MKEDRIQELLRKYLEAATTLDEENELADFFASTEVPEELESYKHEFIFYNQIRLLKLDKDFDQRVLESISGRKTNLHGRWIKPGFIIKAAACILLLLTGFAAGIFIRSNRSQQNNSEAINSLTSQIDQLRQLTALTLIKQESVQDRLQALAVASRIKTPDVDLLNHLLLLVDSDENINIRLAALETLHPFFELPQVKERLVHAVVKQSSVLMQMALLKIIQEQFDKKYLNELKQMLNSPAIDRGLKDSLQQMIQTM